MSALEKLLKGEVLTEDEKKSLTPEEIAEADRKVKEDGIKKVQDARAAFEKESERQSQKGAAQFERLQQENTAMAESLVFAELTADGIELTEEKKAKIRDMRTKINTGSMTMDNIVEDFRSAAAAIESKTLFGDRKTKMEFEKNAQQFNAGQAGANGVGTNLAPDGKAYPPEVWDMVKQAQREGLVLTPEAANRTLTKGLRRTFG